MKKVLNFIISCIKLKTKVLLIEIEFFCLHSNIWESIESCSIEKSFLLSCFEIRREGFNKESEKMERTLPTI